MAPTIRIDEEVYAALKAQAEPFVDTPNSVLRRWLNLAQRDDPLIEDVETRRRRTERARPGELLDRHEYDLPILSVLVSRGGSAYTDDVIDAVGEQLNGRLTEKDKQKIRSGAIRWHNRVMWRRNALVRMGLLAHGSRRGLWEISDAGRQALELGKIDYPSGRERVS